MAQDQNGNFLTLRPNGDDSVRRVTVSGTVDANYITAGGEKITILPETPVWKNGEATTFERYGPISTTAPPMTLCYGPSGKLDYVYLSSASQSSDSVTGWHGPNRTAPPIPSPSLAGGRTDYQLYKNGVPATVADLRQYDVATL